MSRSPRLRLVPTPSGEAPLVTVVTRAVVRGPQPTIVRTLHHVTGGSEPQIAVRVGPILIMVADRSALDSFVQAWRQAQEMADSAFPA